MADIKDPREEQQRDALTSVTPAEPVRTSQNQSEPVRTSQNTMLDFSQILKVSTPLIQSLVSSVVVETLLQTTSTQEQRQKFKEGV